VSQSPRVTPNVELVVRAFAAYATGDRARLIAVLHPEAEIVPLAPDLMGTDGPYHGRLGAEQWLDDLGSTRKQFTGEADEVHEDGNTVLVLGRVHSHRPSSGFGFTQRVGWVLTIEDDLIRTFRGYTSHDAARRAARLA
jgi:ketosteroid isomerase-like protein